MTIRLLKINERTVLILVIILYHCYKSHYIDKSKIVAICLVIIVNQLTMADIGVKNIIIILIDLLVRDKMSISNQLTTDILFLKRIKSRSNVKRRRRYHLKLS